MMRETPDGIDRPLSTAVPPHRPTISAAGNPQRMLHVGGGMQPAVAQTVELSDGTRISFAAVAAAAVLDDA